MKWSHSLSLFWRGSFQGHLSDSIFVAEGVDIKRPAYRQARERRQRGVKIAGGRVSPRMLQLPEPPQPVDHRVMSIEEWIIGGDGDLTHCATDPHVHCVVDLLRSEERRVGKECR